MVTRRRRGGRIGVQPFEVDHDVARGIITCRIRTFLSDDHAIDMADTLQRAIARVRARHDHIRMLIDNRAGSVFSVAATEAMDRIREGHHPRDRTAVLASSSLHRMQAVRKMTAGTDVFMSEDEAMAWLLD